MKIRSELSAIRLPQTELAPLPAAKVRPDAFQSKSGSSGPALQAKALPQVRSASVGNDWHVTNGGPNPPVAAGSFLGQLKEGAINGELSALAETSQLSHNKMPCDSAVRAELSVLKPTPPDSHSPVSTAEYTSRIPGASADQVYQSVVSNPSAVFGAAGLTIRPQIGALTDGAKVMLQSPGFPPIWFPIQVHLDPANRAIDITTLDGHPFRGTNNFRFEDDGQGGTRIVQESRFQGSSHLIDVASLFHMTDQQHQTWQAFHAYLFNQFSGAQVAAAS